MSKTIILRCDYFEGSGAGHLKRCNILAYQLKKKGYKPILIIDDSPLEIIIPINVNYEKINFENFDEMRDAGFVKEIALKYKASLVIGDSYRITKKWVNKLKESGLITVLIDDHGIDFKADLIINYTPFNKLEKIYFKQNYLRGPKYFITNSKFCRNKIIKPKKIIAHAGGIGDFSKAKYIYKNLAEIADQENIYIDWICSNPESKKSILKNINLNDNDKILDWQEESSDLWSRYQIVVGPASTSLYEAILQGTLPISFQISDTQSTELKDWLSIGHALHISNSNKKNNSFIKSLIKLAIANFQYFLDKLDSFSKELDTKGADRVVLEIEKLFNPSIYKLTSNQLPKLESGIRKCTIQDSESFLKARITKKVREMSTNPNHIIKWPEHLNWWIHGSADKYLFINNSNSTEAFIWVKEWEIENQKYLTAGWFPASKIIAFTSILKILDWQIKFYKNRRTSYKWVATVHEDNKAAIAINRRFGFVDASPKTYDVLPILYPGTTSKFIVLELIV